jgi:hypothetical protein
MSGVFRVPFAYTGNANVDLSEITAAAGKPLVILGFDIGQTSDVGDTAEEILLLTIKSGQTTSGSGGSAATPVNTDQSGGAASFAAEQANTTKASAGTIVSHGSGWHWNVRMPLTVRFTQEEQILLPAGTRSTLEVPAAADSLTIAGQLIVQEVG